MKHLPEFLEHKGLTPSEVAIAVKLMDGKRSIQIARELFVTEKTVKFHLTSIYKKTGFAGRMHFYINIRNEYEKAYPLSESKYNKRKD